VSLRARLLIGLILVTAAGLVIAGVVTYAAERSFLIGQVDQAAVSSTNAIEDQVDVYAGLRVRTPSGRTQPARQTPVFSGSPGAIGGGPQPLEPIPAGAFGEHLDAAGKVVGKPVIATRTQQRPEPKLPRHYPITRSLAHAQLFTVSSSGGSGVQYRVFAKPSDTGSGTTIIAIALSGVAQTLSRLRLIEAIVIGAVLCALGALAWLLIRLGLRPLDRIGATAGAIAAGDLSRRVSPAESHTEVGRLGLALNAMLGQIEQAFAERQAGEERLRRFLSDASHELRTPLTSIRGYAELFRIGASARPEDTEKAMARIEEEAARMGVLVEDLLALARLDEMPAARREPVDLAALARDAADDARAAARDREVTVTIEGEHLVSGDPSQLRQVLANLMRNALTHTPAGSPIEVSVSSADGFVRFAVRDHGPGLPEGAQASVFERFWRSESGRGRGKAGAGLGLAIVAAIVEAHGGRVSAGNAPGGGASFAIDLPARLGASAPLGACAPAPE
jgi:two-component system OmpR family sensor kinase